MNENKPLPKGWKVKNLGDIGKIFNGNSINATIKKEKYLNINGGMPYIATKDISYENIIDYSNGISIPFEEKSNFRFVPKNTTLICAEGGSAGRKIGFTSQEVCFGNKLFALIVKNGISNKYIYYYYFSDNFQKDFQGQMTGIIGGVSMAKFKKLNIPLPSLPEQKCIVAILDKTFAEITKAEAIAKTNLQNAKELFESYLNNVFENKGDDWEEKTLGEVCKIIGGGTPSKKKEEFYNGDILWATVRDMKVDLIEKTEHQITNDAVKNSSTNIIPKENVVIATRVGLGKVCLIKNDTAINQDLKGVIPLNNKKLLICFLFRWFQSISNKIINEGTGATVQGVKLTFINSLNISFPSIQKQKQITQQLDQLQTQVKKLEIIYQQKITDLSELKKSILQKAFNGEL
ncbi:Type I restriction-modification system, specificity subunit S [uncultured Gammaproteobacteria bacterium]|nr:Type I restriction-modification system, specificity subunit S [uncultured Gammaproteobacteria bacterium]